MRFRKGVETNLRFCLMFSVFVMIRFLYFNMETIDRDATKSLEWRFISLVQLRYSLSGIRRAK